MPRIVPHRPGTADRASLLPAGLNLYTLIFAPCCSENNLEFNLRHDWNSLLDGDLDKIPLFGNWSKEYWPPAETLVDYINAFAAPQVMRFQ